MNCFRLLDGSRVASQEVPDTIRVNLSGQQFGRLTVVGYAGRIPYGTQGKASTSWIAKCECGSFSLYTSGNLTSGWSTQCNPCGWITTGQKVRKHGMSGTRVYNAWQKMIVNCKATSGPNYQTYGKQGITVCQRWVGSVEAFIADMGQPPSGHWLDRIDKAGNFTPDNCQWATPVNRSPGKHFRMLTINRETMSTAAWARRVGISSEGMRLRLMKYPPEIALTCAKGSLPWNSV